MLAAGEEGKWKEFLPSMGTEAHIPKLFKSSSKARGLIPKNPEPHAKGATPGLLLGSEVTYRVSRQGAFYIISMHLVTPMRAYCARSLTYVAACQRV